MPYEKIYKGQRETGVVNTYDYVDENGETCFMNVPEKEAHHEIEWRTPWQPEHAPVGSVVRYRSAASFDEDAPLKEVTVTGHYWNGIKSWVILTNDVCPILGKENKCSFNGDHLREIVSRGKGGIQFTNNLNTVAHYVKSYKDELAQLPVYVKRPHEYAAWNHRNIIGYVLTTHPKFAGFFDGVHENISVSALTWMLGNIPGLFTLTRYTAYTGYVTVNKKKLIKAMLRLIARGRSSKMLSWKAEQKAAHEDYMRDMKSFCDDL
jgi:hypothetical protein